MKTSSRLYRLAAACFLYLLFVNACTKMPANPAWLPDRVSVPFRVSLREVRAGGKLVVDWTLEETEPGHWQLHSDSPWAGELACTPDHPLELSVAAADPADAAAFRGVNLYSLDKAAIVPQRLSADACRYRLQYRADSGGEGVSLLVSTAADLQEALAASPGDSRTIRLTLPACSQVPVEWLKIAYSNASLGEYEEYELRRGAMLHLPVYYQQGVSRVRMLSILDYYPHHTTDDDVYYTDDGVWTRLQLQGQAGVQYRPRLGADSWFGTEHPGAWTQAVGKRIWVTYGDYVPNQFVLYTKKDGTIGARFTVRTAGVHI
ncbi:MAG: hypothetical protein J5871_02695 [Bacteroidales bacterium]|nr:hypothetical protein [Bacteroidales bacterium]